MLRFASRRLLVPSLFLLCLLSLVPASHAQDAPKPTPAVQKLADQATVAEQADKHEEALRLGNEALTQARQGKDVAGEALTLKTIGNVYSGMRQPQKALELYNQALPLARAVGDKLTEANTLSNIGNVYNTIGQPQKALEFYQQVLPMFRQLGNKSREANTLNSIGHVYVTIGQVQKALEFYQQAMSLARAAGDKLTETNMLNSIGFSYNSTGQPQKGLEMLKQALSLYRQLGNKNLEALTLANIAVSYRFLGQMQKALEHQEQALTLYRTLGDKNGEARTLNDIGDVYLYIGQPQKALAYAEQALLLYRQFGDKSKEARALIHIEYIYNNGDQLQKGLEAGKQALRICRQIGNKNIEAEALENIVVSYNALGQPQKAVECQEQALRLFRTLGNKNGEAFLLTCIGWGYQGIGQPRKALAYLQSALHLYAQLGDKYAEARAFAGDSLAEFGDAYNKIGQPQKGLEFYQHLLPLFRLLGDKNMVANTLDYIATSEQRLSRVGAALTHVRQAVAVLEELRANVGSQGEGRSTLLASKLHVYYHALNLLRQNGKIAEAFALAQKTKARSLLDLLAANRVDLMGALTPEERQELQALQQQAESLSRQLLKEGVENEVGAKKRFAALQTQLKRTESQLQTLTDKLYALHPGLADQQQARTATVSDLAPLLPSDTALLEYVQTTQKELLLFVVTTKVGKAQVRLYPITINEAQFQKQCAAFHDACADPRKNPAELSASLSRLLLSPAQMELTGKKRLIVCPDSALWDVPFAALRSPGRSKRSAPLWQQYELSYAYSATGMQAAENAHRRHKPAEHASVLALANPFFGSSSRFGDLDGVPGQRPIELPSRPIELPSRPFERPSRPFELPSRPFDLPSRPIERPSRPIELPSRQLTAAIERGKVIKSLPGAQQEAEAIHKLFPDAAIYTGKAAQESVVMAEAGKYKYLHFATHGFFNDAAPLLSCIVLAQPEHARNKTNQAQGGGENNAVTVADIAPNAESAQADAEDGLLTARKVFGLHLNADLVTLSACNSGRGQVRTGDGIVGLTWAFFAAGCPSQVVSQWSVDDAATGQLMADFYKGLKAGKSKSAALRSAALKLSKDGKHQHPYYWTPFFLMGDWK